MSTTTSLRHRIAAAALTAGAITVGAFGAHPIASAEDSFDDNFNYDGYYACVDQMVGVGYSYSDSVDTCCGSYRGITIDGPDGKPNDCVGVPIVDEESSIGQPSTKPGVPDPGKPSPPPLENPGQPTKPGVTVPMVPNTGRG